MFHAKIYEKLVSANNLGSLKRKASMIANSYYNPQDSMLVWMDNGPLEVCFVRRNTKAPNNTIVRGKWA